MSHTYQVQPIGWIRKTGDEARIDIDPAYEKGLLGLDGFSHIVVCYWFHENDNPPDRSRMQVRPRKDPANPLTGVFATHAPVRPNLIAISVCRVLSIAGTSIRIEEIDAREDTPVIDIKCYIPDRIDPTTVRLPDWV